MATLCNACGINYRRALSKTPTQHINLDRLAQQTGSTRLSIQKALKRQRKVSSSSSSSSPHSSHSSSSSPSSPQHRTVRSASQPPPMKSSPTNSTATSATIPSSSSSSTWHSAGGKISVAELLDDHNTSSPMSSSKTHGQLPPKYGMQEKAQVFTHQNQQQSSASIGRLRPYIHFPSQPTQQHQQQHQHQPSSSTSRHLRNGPHMGGGGGGRMSNVHHNEQHHHHAMASSSSRLGKQVNGSTSLPSFNNLIGNLHLQQN